MEIDGVLSSVQARMALRNFNLMDMISFKRLYRKEEGMVHNRELHIS